jgi:integrase
MKRAGIPRECPEGRARGEKRTFHSFRHTFAKQALATKASLSWLQEHLGHSSINVTRDIYGHFERAEHKKQIKELEGAFGV